MHLLLLLALVCGRPLQINSINISGNTAKGSQTFTSEISGNAASNQTNEVSIAGNTGDVQKFQSLIQGNSANFQSNAITSAFNKAKTQSFNESIVANGASDVQTNSLVSSNNIAQEQHQRLSVSGNAAGKYQFDGCGINNNTALSDSQENKCDVSDNYSSGTQDLGISITGNSNIGSQTNIADFSNNVANLQEFWSRIMANFAVGKMENRIDDSKGSNAADQQSFDAKIQGNVLAKH